MEVPPSEHGAWECSGRVMILFRVLTQNTLLRRVERLKSELSSEAQSMLSLARTLTNPGQALRKCRSAGAEHRVTLAA